MSVNKYLWENISKTYNDMFNYLEELGVSEKDRIQFAKLLGEYEEKFIKLKVS